MNQKHEPNDVGITMQSTPTLASAPFDARSSLKRAKTQPKAKAGYRKHYTAYLNQSF